MGNVLGVAYAFPSSKMWWTIVRRTYSWILVPLIAEAMGVLQSQFGTHPQWHTWLAAARAAVLATGTAAVVQAQLASARYVQAQQQETVVEWIRANRPQVMFAILEFVEQIADLTRPM
jgi:hypothetical protein